jgi:hypothetical protein
MRAHAQSTPRPTHRPPARGPRRPAQILEIKTESPDLVSALSTLSQFYDDNTPAARRALRSTIEQRGLDINQHFLGAAESVMQVQRPPSCTAPALMPSTWHCRRDH